MPSRFKLLSMLSKMMPWRLTILPFKRCLYMAHMALQVEVIQHALRPYLALVDAVTARPAEYTGVMDAAPVEWF